jgi:DNA polymerase-1
MQERGLRVNVDGLHIASQEAGEQIQILTKELQEVVGYEINPNSTKQLKEYFYDKKKVKPYVSRKTGAYTVDEKALKRISRKGFIEAEKILEIRRLSKLKGTYLDVGLDSDSRLRSAFNPVGTESGRLSSSKTIFGTGTNLQNQPPEMKKYILADEGYVMYNIDLSQAENRIVAYVAPEPKMIEAFEGKQDVHRLTAGLIFDKPIDEISDEDGSCVLGGGRFSERFWGKKANHGLNYDLGYKTFALYYEMDEAEAKFIVERYHLAYPGIRQYHKWVVEDLSRDRTLVNCFGRRRLFLDRWGDALFKEAYSFIPQSTTADKINRDGVNFIYYNQDKFHDVELLNQVHDSIVFQIPISIGWSKHVAILREIKASLESPIEWAKSGITFSIPAEVQAGFNLKDMTVIRMDGTEEDQLEVLFQDEPVK